MKTENTNWVLFKRPQMKTSEYSALYKRIANANDKQTLLKLERSCSRIYNAGFLTPKELGSLDIRIMEKLATIQN